MVVAYLKSSWGDRCRSAWMAWWAWRQVVRCWLSGNSPALLMMDRSHHYVGSLWLQWNQIQCAGVFSWRFVHVLSVWGLNLVQGPKVRSVRVGLGFVCLEADRIFWHQTRNLLKFGSVTSLKNGLSYESWKGDSPWNLAIFLVDIRATGVSIRLAKTMITSQLLDHLPVELSDWNLFSSSLYYCYFFIFRYIFLLGV